LTVLHPFGSHPLLDFNYSSIDVQIQHNNLVLTRLARTTLVADWEAALQSVRVCNNLKEFKPGTSTAVNARDARERSSHCGRSECSKKRVISLRSMSRKASLLAKMNFGNLTDYDYLVASYQELIGPLK
jgi:hypothetical protein